MVVKEPKQPKEKREKTILPSSIENGDANNIVLVDASLATLGAAQTARKEYISNFDKTALDNAKLELKAINAEIRRRAK